MLRVGCIKTTSVNGAQAPRYDRRLSLLVLSLMLMSKWVNHNRSQLRDFLQIRVYWVDYRLTCYGSRSAVVDYMDNGSSNSTEDYCDNLSILKPYWLR